MTDSLTAQLTAPHPDGTAIALYRTRAYRFTDDPRHYVFAEALEENYAQGTLPSAATLTYIRAVLDQIRATGQLLPFNEDIAAAEGVDIRGERDARVPYAPRLMPEHQPTTLVFIIGAPRSGTSHLFNLLAYTGRFAYFTTASCWAWPTRNLSHPARRSFETIGDRVLAVDNKNTRLIPGLLMPYEAEDLYHRAVPTYEHRGGHTYDLQDARLTDQSLLNASIQAHCRHFARTSFLTKSPFNSLRIAQLDAATGQRALFLNITRDQEGTADSMRRNHFRFHHHGTPLTEEEAWELFTTTIDRDAPAERTLAVSHHDLLNDSGTQIQRITRWLDVNGVSGTADAPTEPGRSLG
ncbi:sulfotransferase [Streptomyces sp. ISL-94]|uniref:sulfotransferase n=1 Tax=Streptomyces sp. ISL-94 TaxID=2819190 RepID=UPI001BEBDB1B|nr:sulfotransferase [Streptomyces sp. ISL-94]MBT2478373.1 sulfotransferase [Streptomyces sp. ISL-94]